MTNKKANTAVKENETIVKNSFKVSDFELFQSLNDANVSNLIQKASSKKSSLYRFAELQHDKKEINLEKTKNVRQICRKLLKNISANVVNDLKNESNKAIFLAYAHTFCIAYDNTLKSISNIKESAENANEYNNICKAIEICKTVKLSEIEVKELKQNGFKYFAKHFESYLISSNK